MALRFVLLTCALAVASAKYQGDISTISSASDADGMVDSIFGEHLEDMGEYLDTTHLEDLTVDYKGGNKRNVGKYDFSQGQLSEITKKIRRVGKSKYVREDGGYTVQTVLEHKRLRVRYNQVQVQGRAPVGTESSPAMRAQYEKVRVALTLQFREGMEFQGLRARNVRISSVEETEVEVRRGVYENRRDQQLEVLVGSKLQVIVADGLKRVYQEVLDTLRQYHA